MTFQETITEIRNFPNQFLETEYAIHCDVYAFVDLAERYVNSCENPKKDPFAKGYRMSCIAILRSIKSDNFMPPIEKIKKSLLECMNI